MIEIRRQDVLDGIPHFKSKSADLVFGDLPYGKTGCKWDVVIPFDPMWVEFKRIRKKRAPIVLFGSEPFSSFLRCSNVKEHKFDWMWDKILKTGHLNSKIMPMGQHEIIKVFADEHAPISVFGKGGIEYYPIMEEGEPQHSEGVKRGDNNSDNYGKQTRGYKDQKGNTLKYPSSLSLKFQKVHPSKCLHPTQKPLDLTEYLLNTHSKPGDLVYDPAAGVNTIPIGCIKTGRNCIAFEKDHKIFEDGRRRVEEFVKTLDFDPDVRFIYT